MPVILLKGERVSNSKHDPRLHSDIASLPCPLFSGHLLKLGLSGQWQSRLFTFDGSGKKKKVQRGWTGYVGHHARKKSTRLNSN